MKLMPASRCLGAALIVLTAFDVKAVCAQTGEIEPILAFPEAGLDDPAAYQGYQTRFFRDALGNVVQIYLDTKSGRVVTLLADAVNESVGFTVRDSAGRPLRLQWGSKGVTRRVSPGKDAGDAMQSRTIEYQLVADAPSVDIGWILLGTMRVERDLQYSGRHVQPFGTPTFKLPEQEELIANIERLPAAERDRHLQLLNAKDVATLRSRLEPRIGPAGSDMRASRGVRAWQNSLDGRTGLQLELSVDSSAATIRVAGPVVSIRSKRPGPTRFRVSVTTDAPSLAPLSRSEIFNAEFLRFLGNARAESRSSARFRRLEREVRSVELLSSREKLMAGMPNYATYFGRDMMMTSLMMEPIWSDAMFEHVIASVLRKLGPAGDVSHEEALGGQAIRENASEYNALMKEYFTLYGTRTLSPQEHAAADSALPRARSLLANLQKVRENYHMLDDEFQLPLIAARYLVNPRVSSSRKVAFLMDSSDGRGPRVLLLLRELALVSKLAAPYGREPVVRNLVGAPRIDSTHWRSVSWRDSGVGYANGRFAMDINAIWVPRALESTSEILASLRSLGFARQLTTAISGSPLGEFARDPALLKRAIENWNGAVKHFVVSLSPSEIQSSMQRKLQSIPAQERAYWERVLTSTGADRQPLQFLALSLDENGQPIRVANSDPATWLLLRDRRDDSAAARDRATRDVRAFMRVYPVGLFVEGLGPLVANDAYASPEVWAAFERDRYHSPRVVWGREVNLFMLGLASEISSSRNRPGRAAYVGELRDALRRTSAAVEASGLKHTELWSYEISGGRLNPIRYGAATDIQLWNVTDLAVQFVLSRLPGRQ